MRILVTGSRDWDDWATITQALKGAVENPDWPHTVVHGGARGADELAGREASLLGWQVEVHPADWDKYGVSAGPIRNLEMVKAGADVCLAFIRNGSRGATHCADAAERAGITTYRYLYRNDGGSEHEPRRDPPDSDSPGEAGLPGGSDDYLPIEASADLPYRYVSLSPVLISRDGIHFYEVPEGSCMGGARPELRNSEAEVHAE